MTITFMTGIFTVQDKTQEIRACGEAIPDH